ncbi:zona pellucida sperm-binding protein 3-like isoform X1 [Aphelocoma coerulescens]|uniref:zona pellucida sperm-binding protein 3-like isoform X1 n=1 Tax=Aphelocoma coerulescens TaxID=39617 RepID=UPI0036053930
MELCWLVLLCGAALGVAGTTVAPAASEPPGRTMTAPVMSSGMGTGRVPAHPHSEEPIMDFALRLLDEDSSATEKLPVLSPGSMIHLEASVHFSPSISMKIHVDQCYGTTTEQPGHSRRVFMVVNSRGCLHGEKLGNVSVQHQRGGSVLQLSIPAPTLEGEPKEEQQVYVHCLLMAWGQGLATRSCFYSHATASWHNAEDPAWSAACHCCDTGCPPADTLRGDTPAFPGEGARHWETVGPVLVQEKVPWYKAPCQTVKRLLLAGLALVGSAMLVVAVLGGLLGLALTTWRLGRPQQGQRPPRQRCPFQVELQSVVGTLVLRETEKQGEVGPEPLSQ